MSQKVAIVTGANRGIGFETVRGLCQRYSGVVYLTARDEAKGKAAVAKLQAEGLSPRFHQLDVTDRTSLQRFRDFLKKEHGTINVIINNAGYYDVTKKYTNYEESKKVIDVHYNAIKLSEEFLYPLLAQYGRVVNVNSVTGHLSNLRNKHWLEVLSKKDLTEKEIDTFVDWHLDAVKNGTFKKEDFADEGIFHALRVGKMAAAALTFVQQRQAAAERLLVLNAVTPGLVRTEGSRGAGELDVLEGTHAILYFATVAPHDVKGRYVWHDRVCRDWYNINLDSYFKYSSIFS